MIYLDHNATAPVKPEVMTEMLRVMTIGGNPSSVHAVGRKAMTMLEDSRETIARVVNCRPEQIIFTSGGTEANNIAIMAAKMDHIIIAATEHDSILHMAEHFRGRLDILAVDDKGYVSADELKKLLTKASGKILVSIMLANNETGVIQDIRTLAAIAHNAGALFHSDAVQALGKIPVDFQDSGVDMMSFSAHKISGPQGVGLLVASEDIPIHALFAGGGQEKGRRAGTENLAGIAGFAKAVSLLAQNLQTMTINKKFRDRIEQEISHHAAEVVFYGAQSNRLPNTTTILMPGVASETQVMAFDLDGICVSSGAACSSGKVKPSHVVSAMGASRDQALSTIRVSLGWTTTEDDINRFIAAWIKLYERKRK
ncbi:MAG: cysteine desulfurase [Alphaproteobacteria bacterium]|nr:cysteine desulfurase [Alphaproteobacteria bacterium]